MRLRSTLLAAVAATVCVIAAACTPAQRCGTWTVVYAELKVEIAQIADPDARRRADAALELTNLTVRERCAAKGFPI